MVWTPRKVTEDRAARHTLRGVMDSWPALCISGFSDDRGAEHELERKALLSATSEFHVAIEFLSLGSPGVKRSTGFNSYILKHRAERWAFEIPALECSYIQNGVMIAAAIAFGLGVKREPRSGRRNLSIDAIINLKGLS